VLEFSSIAISVMVFALAWNLRHQESNFTLLVLGLTSLAVSIVDIGHVLSYQGMPDVISPSGGQKSITFWLSGRLIAAIGLLVVAVVRRRRVSMRTWGIGVAAVIVVVTATTWVGMVQPDWLPTFYASGSGLTPLKKVIEYAIAGVLLLAAILFMRRARREADREMAWLAAASWTLGLTDLFFTMYANVTDLVSVIGHLYKVIAYAMIYLAIFAAGVRRPYEEAARDRSLLRSLIDSMPDLIVVKNTDKEYVVANAAYQRYEDVDEAALLGKTSGQVLGEQTGSVLEAMDQKVLLEGATLREDVSMPAADGSERIFDTLKAPFRGPGGEHLGIISLSRDITDKLAANAAIDQLSNYDPLTGLPNQSLLALSATRELRIAEQSGQSIAFVVFDLDDFHTVNDAVGHDSGDVLLQQIGLRLRDGIEPRDMLAHPGGDEFVAVLTDTTPEDAGLEVARLLELVRRPFPLGSQDLTVTISAGIAMYPQDGSTYEELRRFAEGALYRAKSEGRDTLRFFTDEMQQNASTRLQMLNHLRAALAGGEFRVHYQPQMLLADESVCGAEALVRWQHPTLGLIAPGAFIPLAEETGLILPIGDWVAAQAMSDLREWRRSGSALPSISINLSAAQFRQSDLVSRLSQIADEAGIPFGDVDWELTESAAMVNPEESVTVIRGLHDRGFVVSLDDFGTGYSSMTYLKRYHIDRLKIDRSFVSEIATDSEDLSIVRAVIQLARTMGCSVVAEGVETAEQVEVLKAEGCQIAQGYYFARPMPAEAMAEFLLEHEVPLASAR
jgi:diguanylate cyclase (GGDEF)-like protein/PAS domain S-box-containing protein